MEPPLGRPGNALQTAIGGSKAKEEVLQNGRAVHAAQPRAISIQLVNITGIVQGGNFFHPTDEGLSAGTPVEEITTRHPAFCQEQNRKRYTRQHRPEPLTWVEATVFGADFPHLKPATPMP
jgi:hypothetical protein